VTGWRIDLIAPHRDTTQSIQVSGRNLDSSFGCATIGPFLSQRVIHFAHFSFASIRNWPHSAILHNYVWWVESGWSDWAEIIKLFSIWNSFVCLQTLQENQRPPRSRAAFPIILIERNQITFNLNDCAYHSLIFSAFDQVEIACCWQIIHLLIPINLTGKAANWIIRAQYETLKWIHEYMNTWIKTSLGSSQI